MRTHIATAIVVSMLLQPQVAWAASPRLIADDTIAGLGTSVEVTGLQPNEGFTLTLVPPYGPEVTYQNRTNTSGSAMVVVPAEFTEEAGVYGVEFMNVQASFEVFADTVDLRTSTLEVQQPYASPNGEPVAVRVILRDRFNNPLSGRPVQLVPSRTSDTVEAQTMATNDQGEQRFLVTTHEAGLMALRAVDLLSGKIIQQQASIQSVGSLSQARGGYEDGWTEGSSATEFYGSSNTNTYASAEDTDTWSSGWTGSTSTQQRFTGQVTGGIVDHFVIDIPERLEANNDYSMSITAVDVNGSPVPDYIGNVLLSTTDPEALLPLDGVIPFKFDNQGERFLTLGFRPKTPGEQRMRAVDSQDPSIMTEIRMTVVGDASAGTQKLITITEPAQNSNIGSTNIILKGVGPPFINLRVMGGAQDAFGETAADGTFAIPVTLNQGQVDHTLRVQEQTGKYDSGNLYLKLDTTPPDIISVEYAPLTPEEGEKVLMIVKSETKLKSVKVKLAETEQELPESATASGSYQGLFTAPVAGNYQAEVHAEDTAGNRTELRSQLTVLPEGLPAVQNLSAEGKPSAVALRWDAITMERIDAYRIYVGDSERNFLYTLETDKATTAATVAGLSGGQTYYFAVTALQGDRESAEKSNIVSAEPVGLNFSATPGDASLLLEWSGLDSTPLSAYVLEYGVEEGNYTEKRQLSGDMKAYTLRDLLNGVTYYLRLTPVTVTGEPLADVMVTTEGMPNGNGFVPTQADPLPFTPGSGLTGSGLNNPPAQHPSAPQNPSTGIPPFALAGVAVALTAGMMLHLRRRRGLRMTSEFLQAMESKYHS